MTISQQSTPLAEVVATATEVGGTAARRVKLGLLAELLRRLHPGEIEAAVGLLTAAPRQGKLGVGWRSLTNLSDVVGTPPREAVLTVLDVDASIEALATAAGPGSVGVRGDALQSLWARATAPERHFLASVLLGEVRMGALAGMLTEAVAQAAGMPSEPVRRAVMLSGSLGRTAYLALTGSLDAVAAVALQVGTPVHPMLASTAGSVAEAVAAVVALDADFAPENAPEGAPGAAGVGASVAVVEAKLDGARIQVHRMGGPGSEVRVFTRTLADITERLPEIVDVVSGFPGGAFILDGETLALDEDGGPRPFQDTMSRFGSASGAEILRPWFFDVLHFDGVDLIDEPLFRRREVLAGIVGGHGIPSVETADPVVAEAFSREVLAAGHEGVLVKSLTSRYAAGRRGKPWLKVKPVHTYDLVVLAVEWGSGRRTGTLSNLHLGARDPQVPLGEKGDFVMVGKTFKGLTDALLAWQTERLLALETSRTSYAVHVRPELVVEIAIDGVQRSSRYAGGLALRFARVKRYREDKAAAQADTIQSLQALLR